MKKTKLIFKPFLIIVILILTISVTTVKKTEAGIVDLPSEIGTLVENITGNASDIVSQIKNYTEYVQQGIQAYKTAKATVQQVNRSSLGDTAMNITSSQMLNLGTTVLNLTVGDQGTSTNVFTKGNQVVTDLGGYLDQVGTNEIKKALVDLQDPSNLSAYSSDIKQAITTFTKNADLTKSGQIVTFTLPYIARDEICNSPKLKDVITNGEPKNYVLPKEAVGDLDINQACQESGTLMSPKDQAVFIGLAKAGYGGDKTVQALADPANSKEGVVANALSVIKNKVADVTGNAKSEVTATDLYIGQKQCFDKQGKLVNYEPGSTNLQDQVCYQSVTDPLHSGSVVKNNTAAALMAPYLSMLSKAGVVPGAQNSACGSSIDTVNTDNNIKNTGNDLGFNENSNTKIGNTADVIGAVGSCSALLGNAITSVINLFGPGKKGADDILNGTDNPYSRLYENLSAISTSQEAEVALADKANQEQKDYEYGSDYTVGDLQNTINTYSSIRELNIDRLNNELFTYAYINLAIDNAGASIPDVKYCTFNIFGTCKKTKASYSNVNNVLQSLAGLKQAAISLNDSIRDLIRLMASNNYKNQQLNTLYNTFKALPNDTLVASTSQYTELKKALDGSLTQEDLGNLESEWQYTPQIIDNYSNPLAPNTPLDGLSSKEAEIEKARRSQVLIVPQDEKTGPYTARNTLYLRARADKILLTVLDKETELSDNSFPGNTSLTTKALLSRYGINGETDLNNGNLPRSGNPEAINILTPSQVATWGENDFCTNLGIMNSICKDLSNPGTSNHADLEQSLQNVLESQTSFDELLHTACLDPTNYVKNACANSNNTLDPNCASDQSDMVTELISYCSATPTTLSNLLPTADGTGN